MSSISQPRRKLVFSEEDDISLLKAINDYEMLKQANPYDDMGKFLDFVKPYLSFDVQRRQLTDKLWRMKNRYVNSEYDISKPHHANLLELSKLIKCWGQHAIVSLDSDNVVSGDSDMNSDSQNVQGVNVVSDDVTVGKSSKVVESKGMGKVVTYDCQQDNVAVDDDTFLNEGRKLGKKKRKHFSRDGQYDKEGNVVLDDADGDTYKNVANSDGQNVRGDAVVVGDVEVDKTSKVVNNKGKGKIVVNKGKGKVMTCDGENDKEDAVVLGNVNVHKEVNRKKLKDSTSVYPELTRALELKALSGMPKKCVMDIISSMGRKKASELEEKWADFRLMEIQLNAKKLDLSNKQIKVILEAARK